MEGIFKQVHVITSFIQSLYEVFVIERMQSTLCSSNLLHSIILGSTLPSTLVYNIVLYYTIFYLTLILTNVYSILFIVHSTLYYSYHFRPFYTLLYYI